MGLFSEMDLATLSLTTADFDFPPAQEVLDAVKEALKQGRTSYGDPWGDRDVLEVVCERVRRKNRLPARIDDVCAVPGASVGIFFISWHFLAPRDEAVIVPSPVHESFYANPSLVGARLKESPARRPEFTIDVKDLEKKISRRTKLLMICNPHNPLGRVFTRKELEAIAELAQRHRLFVFSNELYDDLVYEGEHLSIASLDQEMAERTVTLLGWNKVFNLSGLRVAYLVNQGEVMKKLKPKLYSMIHQTDRLAQAATKVAWGNGGSWLEGFREHLQAMRDYCLERIRENPRLKCHVPEAGPFLFIDIQSYGLKSDAFAQYLEKEAHVRVVPGRAFGPAGEGYVRIHFGASQAVLSEAFDRMEKAIEKLR